MASVSEAAEKNHNVKAVETVLIACILYHKAFQLPRNALKKKKGRYIRQL